MYNILNVIDKIYSSEHFTTVLIAAIVVLITLFVIVLIMGIVDKKKEELKKQKEIENLEEDITFSEIKEEDKIKEDITFEYPSITKNLEEFKMSLEKELNQEKDNLLPLERSQKPYKVINVSEIEDTTIIPNLTKEDLDNTIIIPKAKVDHISMKEKNNIDDSSDYLKQNIFSSAK